MKKKERRSIYRSDVLEEGGNDRCHQNTTKAATTNKTFMINHQNKRYTNNYNN